MKSKMKKLLCLLLAAMMILGVTACGAKETEAPEAPEAAVEETVEETEEAASWTNDDSAEIVILLSGDNTPDEDNIVIQELEKKTNTNIKIIYTSNADVDSKRNTLIAGGDVPDIFYVSANDALPYKEKGLLADMKDVLAAVAPSVLDDIKESADQMALNKDGYYMIPKMAKPHVTNLMIREDWMANLGLETPTDLESFAEVLHAFTYDDPDGNGRDDTFGFCMNFDEIMGADDSFSSVFGAYGIAKARPNFMEDGTISTWAKHPNFLEAMKYIKGLIDDGVCEPDFMTIPTMSMYEKLWVGAAGVIEMGALGPCNNWLATRYIEDPKPSFDYALLEGPEGDCGVVAKYPEVAGGFVISSACENLEGVARIIEFCMTEEGADLLYLGVEGVMYEWEDKQAGTYKRLGEYADDAVHRANGGMVYDALFQPESNTQLRVLNEHTREGIAIANANMIDWPNILEPSTVYAEFGGEMDQVIKELVAELLTSDIADFEDIYADYIEEWESVGGTEWEEEVTALWEAQNK